MMRMIIPWSECLNEYVYVCAMSWVVLELVTTRHAIIFIILSSFPLATIQLASPAIFAHSQRQHPLFCHISEYLLLDAKQVPLLLLFLFQLVVPALRARRRRMMRRPIRRHGHRRRPRRVIPKRHGRHGLCRRRHGSRPPRKAHRTRLGPWKTANTNTHRPRLRGWHGCCAWHASYTDSLLWRIHAGRRNRRSLGLKDPGGRARLGTVEG